MAAKKTRSHYVVTWRDLPKEGVVTMRVRTIEDSDLGPTFIAISDFVFEHDGLIIDPNAAALEARYADTRRLHLSIYNVLAIEEVGRRNKGLELKDRSNVVLLTPTDKSTER
jgi:hypothetical protein